MPSSRQASIIGNWSWDPAAGILSRDGVEARLTAQQQKLLCVLMEHAGKVVDRNTLLDEVWDGVAVEDSALARGMSELRSILGDDARSPSYIETLPKRGYRLIAEVEDLAVEAATPPAAQKAKTRSRRVHRGFVVFSLLGLLVVGGLAFDRASRPIDTDPGDVPDLRPRAEAARARGIEAAKAGRYDEAEQEFDRALALFRQLGDSAAEARQLSNLARLHLLRGEWAEAAVDFAAAEPVLAALSSPEPHAILLVNLGLAHAATGNLRLARAPLRRAAETFRELDEPLERANALSLSGEVLIDLDEFDEALSALEEGLDLREAHGDDPRIANSRIALAHAWIETGNHEAAVRLAESVQEIDSLTKQKILADRLVARGYLAEGNVEEARRAIDRATDRMTTADDLDPYAFVHQWLPITVARVEIAEGRFEPAARRLRTLLEDPRLRRLRLIEAEARLALAEAEAAAGDVDGASRRLAELLEEADAAGWKLLSSKILRASASLIGSRPDDVLGQLAAGN